MNSENFEEFRSDVIKMLDGLYKHASRIGKPANRRGSQCEEDEIISSFLSHNCGIYIDVGASHPVECSNTWALYQNGWRGLLIEPLYTAWPAILRDRPGDFLSPYAVMDYTGFVNLRVSGSVSSVREDWNIDANETIVVECDTLSNILDHYPHIRDNCEVLSIDVEGVEKQVIKGADFSILKPRVLVVEKVIYDPEKTGMDISSEWEQMLLDQYFKLRAETELNKIYTRSL